LRCVTLQCSADPVWTNNTVRNSWSWLCGRRLGVEVTLDSADAEVGDGADAGGSRGMLLLLLVVVVMMTTTEMIQYRHLQAGRETKIGPGLSLEGLVSVSKVIIG